MSAVPQRPIHQKNPPIRDEKYRRHVASQPCMACGYHQSQAAHISVGNFARGMKADDTLCIPLCVECHDHFDGRRSGLYTNQKSAALGLLGLTIPELKDFARAAYDEWKAAI